MPRHLRATLLALAVLSLSACGLFPSQEEESKNWSASKFYTEAKTALKEGDYGAAIKLYEQLEARYPFGPYAQQAQLEVAYAYYKDQEPESAVAAADRFIKQNPRHPNVDYAYYLKGLVNFNRNLGFIERYVPTDHTQRDQAASMKSFEDFSDLVKKHPNSKYADDARQRMLYLRNNVSAYEVHVARYYLKRGAFLAAVNRSKEVIEKYQKTPAVEEALAIQHFAYEQLGMKDLAADVKRVITRNHPQHPLVQGKASLGDYTAEANPEWWKFWLD
jgi:outer membrane protein assembly factor BamD